MINDPIVEEIRQIRAKIFAECDGDLDKLMDRYEAAQERDKDRLVTLEDVKRRSQETDRRLSANPES